MRAVTLQLPWKSSGRMRRELPEGQFGLDLTCLSAKADAQGVLSVGLCTGHIIET